MSKKPLVSIIVPVYNGELTIAKTIESILAQTYNNLEIIIVDDCSTDSSRKIIESYNDSRIKTVFLERNLNICGASNEAFKLATGKYLALTGHDDLWHPQKTEIQVDYLESHPQTLLCFSRIEIIDENDYVVTEGYKGMMEFFDYPNMSREDILFTLLAKTNIFCAPSAMMRTDAVAKTGLYRYGLLQTQDYDLWLRLLCIGEAYTIEERLTYYRRFSDNTHNLSSYNTEGTTRESHEKHYSIYDVILKMDDELFKNVFREDINNINVSSKEGYDCEKALILSALENCFAYQLIIELLESPSHREYFKEYCNFTPSDFYKLNSAPIRCDDTYYNLCLKQNEIISKLQSL